MWASQVTLVVKNTPANVRGDQRCKFDLWVWKIPWRRAWQPTPVFLPGESHGQRSNRVHRITKNQTWLKWISMHSHTTIHLKEKQSSHVCKKYIFICRYLSICIYLFKIGSPWQMGSQIADFFVDCIFWSFYNKQNEKLAIRKQQHKTQLGVSVLCGTFRFFGDSQEI